MDNLVRSSNLVPWPPSSSRSLPSWPHRLLSLRPYRACARAPPPSRWPWTRPPAPPSSLFSTTADAQRTRTLSTLAARQVTRTMRCSSRSSRRRSPLTPTWRLPCSRIPSPPSRRTKQQARSCGPFWITDLYFLSAMRRSDGPCSGLERALRPKALD